ncbi:MAG: N-acetyltransferase [Mobilitalea sp.]
MIREYKKQDLDRIMELWLETNILAHSFINDDYWKSNFDAVKEMMPNAILYVFEDGQDILGFIGLTDEYIAGIFVSDQHQSQGIGKQLLDYAKKKYSDLSLHVYIKNNRAISFYQRECFVIVNEQVDENTSEIEIVMNWKRKNNSI